MDKPGVLKHVEPDLILLGFQTPTSSFYNAKGLYIKLGADAMLIHGQISPKKTHPARFAYDY